MSRNSPSIDSVIISKEDLIEITPFELAFKHFNSIWESTQHELQNLVKTEAPVDNPKIIEKRLIAVRETSVLYLKYIRMCNKLIYSYEHIPQPQKRRFLRNLSEACIGRVLELKHALVDFEKSDFQFLDQGLLELKMLPSDMDIKIPEYCKELVNEKDIENKKIVENYLKGSNIEDQEAVTEDKKNIRMSKVFLKMIQSHEKARQDSAHFQNSPNQSTFSKVKEQKGDLKNESFSKTETDCALVIQRAWRRFLFRKRLKDLYLIEMKFLNILPSPQSKNAISQDIEKHRRTVIKRNEGEYLVARKRMTEEMFVYQAPRFSEELEETIRSYIHEYKEIHKQFPTFPSDEEGGSVAMLLVPLVPKAEEKEPEVEEKKERKNTKSPKDSKDKKSKKKKKGKDSEDEEDEPVVYVLKPSKYLSVILKLLEEYKKSWMGREPVNFDKFDEELLKDEVTAEVKTAVRLVVDEKMRAELERLEKAFRKDTKKKKKQKKGKKKEKKGKKKEKGKKGKAKKEIDLTPDRSVESLVSELIDNGIITNYPKITLNDFVGDYNYFGGIQEISGQFDSHPLPCLADIKRVLKEYCVLPMGSEAIHSGEAYIKSILIAGPKGSGKTTLVYSICNEISATLMNLSAENLEGKYPGDDGLEMLMHLVSKVSRLVQPTIIYVKDAENYFWKEKPKTSRISEPNRLSKHLPKLIKKIGHSDRVLVCGTTVTPFSVNQKGLSGCYEKAICIFKPDYNCRCQIWREMIKKFGGHVPANVEVSILSSISDGFTAGRIEQTVRKVLTNRRLACQDLFPLRAMDFKNALAEHVPVYAEEHEAYMKWLQKLPLGSEREAVLEKEKEENPVEEEEEESEED